VRAWLLAFCVGAACAPAAAAQQGERSVRLNSSGRTIVVSAPLKDGAFYLGDIELSIDASDRIAVSSARLMDLLAGILHDDAHAALRDRISTDVWIPLERLEGTGVALRYEPQAISLVAEIAPALRALRRVDVAPLGRRQAGEFVPPARLSAYLNTRGAINYAEEGTRENIATVLLLDGAVRYRGAVLEGAGVGQLSADESAFQRQGTRLVFDDRGAIMRWTLGDLETSGRGLQAAPRIAGLSAVRSYGALAPELVTRPTGRQSFSIERSSVVEIEVNGRVVRRLFLDPGAYDLRDFPFARGGNDVAVIIRDDTGRTQTLRFNAFSDLAQLAPGLDEFGAFVGVASPLADGGPVYSEDWLATAYYRRGVAENLTLGANLQLDARSRMGGVEMLAATRFGVLGAHLAASESDPYGSGYASIITFERLSQNDGVSGGAFNLALETWSRDFAPVAGATSADNPYRYRLSADYSYSLNDKLSLSVGGRYAASRAADEDVSAYRVSLGWRPSEALSLTGELTHERLGRGEAETALRFSLQLRVDADSSVRVEHDTRQDLSRLSYQRVHGDGDGAYTVFADVEHGVGGGALNANVNYYASRGELGFDHLSALSGGAQSRTSLRFASSIAFADGVASVGRPIQDSFAIVTGHENLAGARIRIDPSPQGHAADTGLFNAATQPDLNSYSERTIAIDAPEAPGGIDLGAGAFRLFPPYRAGYRLEVGSDYATTLVGRLLDGAGDPVALMPARAIELARPERVPVDLFTNRQGRFGASGLRGGRWRIEVLSDPVASYVVDVPEHVGVVAMGDLRPGEGP
jgi:outer membrane usher protein